MTFRVARAAVVAALALSGALARAETLEEVQKKIIDAAEKVKSFTATLTMNMEMKHEAMSMKQEGQGSIEFMRRGDKLMSRMEMKLSGVTKMGDTEQKLEQSLLNIADGEYNYIFADQGGHKSAIKTKIDPNNQSVANAAMFQEWKKDHDLKLLPSEKIEGKEAYVLEITPKKPGGGPLGKQQYYFDKEHGIMVKMVGFEPDGQPMQTITLTQLKLNVDLKPDRFEFKAPEGVEVQDMTKLPTAP